MNQIMISDIKPFESKGKIYTTTDYTVFRFLKGNRDIKSYRRIIDSINDVGYILSPILVNENMEIIDGQNRFMALKELGLPIDFIIQKGIGLNECVSLNINQTNWKLIDYIQSYAETGNMSYIYLLKLIEMYKGKFSIHIILGACLRHFQRSGKGGGEVGILVKKGIFVLDESGFYKAQHLLNKIDEIGFVDLMKSCGLPEVPFMYAVLYAFWDDEINKVRLYQKMRVDPERDVRYGSVDGFLRHFDYVYNKALKTRVSMEGDYMKGLYMKQK